MGQSATREGPPPAREARNIEERNRQQSKKVRISGGSVNIHCLTASSSRVEQSQQSTRSRRGYVSN